MDNHDRFIKMIPDQYRWLVFHAGMEAEVLFSYVLAGKANEIEAIALDKIPPLRSKQRGDPTGRG